MPIFFKMPVRGSRAALTSILVVLFFAACSGAQHKVDSTVTEATVTAQTKNPLPNLAAAAIAGKPHYDANCAVCHGDAGAGQEAAGGALSARPANLTTGKVLSDPDGEIFLAIKNGIKKDGRVTMPPAKRLTDEQIWQVVAYVRTLAKK